jgi:hypothetical protein
MTNTYKREHLRGDALVKRSKTNIATYKAAIENLQADLESYAIQLAESDGSKLGDKLQGDIRPIYNFFDNLDSPSDAQAMIKWLCKFGTVRMLTDKELKIAKNKKLKSVVKYKIKYNAKGTLNIADGEQNENRWDKFRPKSFNGLQQLQALKNLHKQSLEAADINYAELKREGFEVKRKANVDNALTVELEKLIKRFETKSNVA